MEGAREQVPLPDECWMAIALGEHLDSIADASYARRADEDHFERATRNLCRERKYGRVNLTAVGIALNGGIERAEAALFGLENFARQQNGSGTGAKNRLGQSKLFERIEESAVLKKLEHGGRFATGQYEAVESGQFLRFAHQHSLRSAVAKGARVRFVVALKSEYADGDGIGVCGAVLCRLSFLSGHRFSSIYDTGLGENDSARGYTDARRLRLVFSVHE